MIKVQEITRPNDWVDINKIYFKFETKLVYRSIIKTVQNIITQDTEGNSGFVMENGDVLLFDAERYEQEFALPESERAYQDLIDNHCKPVSLMYLWQTCIESMPIVPEVESTLYVFVGRTFEDLQEFMELLTAEIKRQSAYGFKAIDRASETVAASKSKVPVNLNVYVHNLGYEFQTCYRNLWNDKLGTGNNVFARSARKPMKFHVNINKCKVIFKDTLVLTQKSLKAWCKDAKLPIQKLDEEQTFYNQIILPTSPIDEERMRYSINDVVCMVYGLDLYRQKYGTLEAIPMTQTGEVRKTCRERTFSYDPVWCNTMGDITRSYDHYIFQFMVDCFAGGWTHANATRVGRTWHNVKCYDFGSSYPACLTTRRYPVSEWYAVDPKDFDTYAAYDVHTAPERWMGVIRFTGVTSKLQNSYWSLSKYICGHDDRIKIVNQVVDNGRICSCDEMCVKMTDLDYDTFMQCYDVDSVECIELWAAEAGYISKELILTILEYFKYKTSLKGVADAESLYGESKQFINSIYGVAAYKIYSAEIKFSKDKGWETIDDDDWSRFYKTMQDTKDENTFLDYSIGIYVTAWARHNLFDLLIPLDAHMCYADTDSLKGLFDENDEKIINKWNEDLVTLEEQVANTLGFDPKLYTAETSDGKVKRLGIFEKDKPYIYKEFKTLGAKRYCYTVAGDDEVHCTIAGLPKKSGPKKLKRVDEFTNDTFWGVTESGKLLACYNDNQPITRWTDAEGRVYESHAKYGLCLKPATFDLSLSDEFLHFLLALNGDCKDKEFFKDMPKLLI